MSFISVNGGNGLGAIMITPALGSRWPIVDASAALLNLKPADPNDESLKKFSYILARAFIDQFARFVEQLRRGGNFDLRILIHPPAINGSSLYTVCSAGRSRSGGGIAVRVYFRALSPT